MKQDGTDMKQDAADRTGRRFSLAAKMNLVTTGMILLVAGGLLLISYIVQGKRVTTMFYNLSLIHI